MAGGSAGASSAAWSQFAGGVAAGGGSLFGAMYSQRGQKRAARKQREFQERMSNTAYQRSRRDLVKAGYNPLLGHINPATAPQGAKSEITNPGAAIGEAIKGGLLSAQVAYTRAQTAKTQSEKSLIDKTIPIAEIQEELGTSARDTFRAGKKAAPNVKANILGNAETTAREAASRLKLLIDQHYPGKKGKKKP